VYSEQHIRLSFYSSVILFAIRESRIANSAMPLKPQDVMVVLKLLSYKGKRPPMSVIGADLGLSPSEVHAAFRRLQSARLLHGPKMQDRPNLSALEEFLLHGVKYAFPAEHGQVTRGLPTAYAAPPLKKDIASSDELPPVWPWPEGETRGIALEPLYKTAPLAALRDPVLYEFLVLVDAIRDGRARERKIAERELLNRLRSVNAKP
jgi:DNA-binding Lrp family transcriptional regulator